MSAEASAVGEQASASRLLDLLAERSFTIATAESLTGGLLVARLVDVPGASRVVSGGVCTYSFEAKSSILGVDRAELDRLGAVRDAVAREMAASARRVYGCDVALSTTGVAGPGADTCGVEEGTVFIACATPEGVVSSELHLTGGRSHIRSQAVDRAILLAISCLSR